MSKAKVKFLSVVIAVAMFLTAFAQILFFANSFVQGFADVAAGTEEEGVVEVMTDPTYQMLGGLDASDSVKLMSDGTLHGELTPTSGFGGRANSNGLGEGSRYDIAEGVSITLKNVDIAAEACFTVSMQTVSTGTIGAGNGGGVHVAFRVMKEGGSYNFALVVWNNTTAIQWAPTDAMKVLDSENPVWHADTIKLKFTDSSIVVSFTGATGGDFAEVTLSEGIEGFENLFQDYKDDVVEPENQVYHSTKPYLSFSCYNINQGQQKGSVSFDVADINGKTPEKNYKEALSAQITVFSEAVDKIQNEDDQTNIESALEQDVFGEDQAYGKLLAQYGTTEQKTLVAQKQEKLQNLNGGNVFTELKGQIETFIAALDAIDSQNEQTVKAAVTAYNAIDWALYDQLNPTLQKQIDELEKTMCANANFAVAMYAVADTKVEEMEDATAAEFASSKGYNTIKSECENWATYKSENYITTDYLTAQQISELDGRVGVVEGKLENSFYHGLIYYGLGSEVIRYEEDGLYLNVVPDVYPATENAVCFKEKMTLNENSEISFNLIYALRKLGAFQLQIGFYPVAGAMTKGDTDGVRVDFWMSEAGTTEIKPVNGKTELPAYQGAYLSLTDEDFFDMNAEELDYTKSDYTVKLCSYDNGGLYISVNGLEMDITGEGLNADLYKDGVYITVTGVGVKGTQNFEMLVTKVGSTVYADTGLDPDPNPDGGDEDEKTGCSGSMFAGVSFVGATALIAGTILVIKRKKD